MSGRPSKTAGPGAENDRIVGYSATPPDAAPGPASTKAIDLNRLSHECPECGWRLAEGGFCMHPEDGSVYDGVPAGRGLNPAAAASG